MHTAHTVPVTVSLLDRLIDASLDRRDSVDDEQQVVIESVQRDLEDLLNARQTSDGLRDFPELRESMLGFGLPDPAKFDLESPTSRARFFHTIERVITNFEPRVRDVRVSLGEIQPRQLPALNKLQFKIEATLNAHPKPDLSFETTLQISTGHYRIESASTNRLDDERR